ncbi:MAG: ion transporter, partial [Proteobacteria bacterium]|nr:ion transporter [Pseudomonadota bacterium]
MDKQEDHKYPINGIRLRLHRIIFEAETPAGKLFDIILIVTIMLSVLVVMLDSMKRFNDLYGQYLYILEWTFTIVFTIEYLLRIYCTGKPIRYIISFFGIVDLLAILPTYVGLILPSSKFLGVIRLLRVLRVFRVLKLVQYLSEAQQLVKAMHASHRKIEVFLYGVLTMVVILGSLMYVIEGEENGFSSIPRGVYWAIVTMTTVGYGDIAPKTDLGQALASVVMITGYAIIAVPTGIITAELTRHDNSNKGVTTITCP